MTPTCYNADAVSAIIQGATWPLMVGAFIACYVGGFAGRASWYCLHQFVLRRSGTWRRFQRALDRVFAA
jgi:hypothetical protein